MKLNELIEELQALREEMAMEMNISEDAAGDAEVALAYQPNYPLQADAEYVTGMARNGKPYVYIGTGDGNDYAPRCAWDGGFVNEEREED